MNTSKRETLTLSWVLAGTYVVWALGLKRFLAHYSPPLAVGVTEQLLLTTFLIAHAVRYYSFRTLAFYAVVTAIVCNVLENLSVMHGFPFGYFHHNGTPKLFNVPYIVTFAYMGLGYVSWMVTQVLLRRTSYRSWSKLIYVAPLIAAFVFTSWDFCIDPIGATIYQSYVYRNPGPWFGTPVSNYFGWLFTTYLIYLPLSLYLRNRGEAASKVKTEPGPSYWLQPVLVYMAVAIGVILSNLGGKSADIILENGKVWNSGDIWGASSLTTLFTMIFISLLALVTLYGSPDDSLDEEATIATKRATFG